jgi:predicted MarR family transcription regulator
MFDQNTTKKISLQKFSQDTLIFATRNVHNKTLKVTIMDKKNVANY